MKLPILFKMNTQGKIEQWEIETFQKRSIGFVDLGYVVTFGELDGKLQTKKTKIHEGKNIGKKNETSPMEQAKLEAKAKWMKQKKKGYVESLEDAKAGKVDKVIKGGVLPMQAFKWKDYKDRVEFPVYVQKKLDGEHCVAIVKNGKATLWTRTRKPILSCPHIIKELEQAFKSNISQTTLFFNGELYKHNLSKKDLEALKGSFRKKKPSPLSLTGELHIFDYVPQTSYPLTSFKNRNKILKALFKDILKELKFIKKVNVFECDDEATVERFFNAAIKKGFEGIMVRNPESPYEHRRSRHLLKYKPKDDAEFKIIGVTPGKDRTVIFNCITKEGNTFDATMKGNKDDNQIYLKNKSKYIGKMLTVEFEGYTGKNNVPQFPVAIRIREKE